MVAEAPAALFAAPEMAPEMKLARILERIPEMKPTKALEIVQSSQWVLSFQPWVSVAVADLLTW